MLLCRCEESLLFRNAREVYVYAKMLAPTINRIPTLISVEFL